MHQKMNPWRRVNSAIAALTGGVAIVIAGFPAPVSAAELTRWQFDPATQQLQVTVPAGTTPRYFLLAQPARIVVDLPNTQVGNVAAQQSYGGAVRQIRVGQFDATSTRIVIELSPDAELAPGQVELQQASATGGTQWVLRPLLAGTIAAQPTPAAPIAASPVIAPAAPTTEAPAPIAIVPIAPSAAIALPDPIVPAVPSASLPPLEPNVVEIPVAPTATVPPLEPNAIEIPITPPPAASTPESSVETAVPPTAAFQAEATAIDPVETVLLPSNSATSTVALNAPPVPSATLPDRPAEPSLPARDPIMLPPAIDSPSSSVSVQVPPPAPTPASRPVPAPPQLEAAAPTAIELPPALAPASPTSQVNVPPLPTRPPDRAPARPASSVEFGQPPSEVPPAVARRSSALLPAGTILSLRYPRDTAIEVESGQPRQEVLILQTAVRDAEGQEVLPSGTQVIGRFESDRSGSRFVAQAVSIEGRNLRLNAASTAAGGDRQVSDDSLLVHSALGALALTLLGGFSGLGLVGGAAAGAATTYLSAPDPVVIQPNQVFEVRLTEDLPR